MKLQVTRFLVIIIAFVAFAEKGAAQEMLNPKQDFFYGTQYFDPYSPYVNIGLGYGYNIESQQGERNLAIDGHFNYKKIPVNVGYFMSTDHFFLEKSIRHYDSPQRLHDLHVGAGWRWERLRPHFGIYGGLSFAAGRNLVNSTADGDEYVVRRGVGLYAQAHYEYKPWYDMGFGVTLYTSISKYFKVFGAQFHVYLSSSYKADRSK